MWPPVREGFGLSLIKGVIEYELGGSVEVEFRPEGVECRMHLPMEFPGAAVV